MKAPKKVITAMAMAALLGGTAVPAFADGDFKTSTGVPGQDPLQTALKKQELNQGDKLTVQGDIEVNGNFTRKINNFPEETQDGHYLQVTMPISLNYTYNLDTDVMQSAKGTVTNESVYVQNVKDSDTIVEGKSVNMSFVKLDVTNRNDNMEYVNDITERDDKVQLPFQVVVTKEGKSVREIPLASIVEQNEGKNTIEIKPNTDLQLEIKKIGSLNVQDKGDILSGETASIGHKMIMKFEYIK